MIETIHVQIGEKIYCQRLKAVVDSNLEHYRENCLTCRFFVGSAEGRGVENMFYDGSDEAISANPNPWVLQDQMSKVSDFEVDMAYNQRQKQLVPEVDSEKLNRSLLE